MSKLKAYVGDDYTGGEAEFSAKLLTTEDRSVVEWR
jgi:hypothetical protein